VSFNKLLWANFRTEAKHRGEQIQDVFDRLMTSYVNVKQPNRSAPSNRQNTNEAKEPVTVVTEEKVWGSAEEEADSEEESGDEQDEEGDGGFKVEPHLPGFGNLVEIDDDPTKEELDEEDDSEEEDPFGEQLDEEEE
jgi:hypothetical protein